MDKFVSGALDEGAIYFHKNDDGFTIVGSSLIPGQEVEVCTKTGKRRTVIVGSILEEKDGVQTASFQWVEEAKPEIDFSKGQVYFRGLDNGDYGVCGFNLVAGSNVSVTDRKGKRRQVRVLEILSEDDDGLQVGTFEWLETDHSDLLDEGRIFFTRLEDETWVIRGKGLEVGRKVKVSRKGKSKQEVFVKEILDEENGIQTAAFENVNEDEE